MRQATNSPRFKVNIWFESMTISRKDSGLPWKLFERKWEFLQYLFITFPTFHINKKRWKEKRNKNFLQFLDKGVYELAITERKAERQVFLSAGSAFAGLA
jgi:hypothetical protein